MEGVYKDRESDAGSLPLLLPSWPAHYNHIALPTSSCHIARDPTRGISLSGSRLSQFSSVFPCFVPYWLSCRLVMSFFSFALGSLRRCFRVLRSVACVPAFTLFPTSHSENNSIPYWSSCLLLQSILFLCFFKEVGTHALVAFLSAYSHAIRIEVSCKVMVLRVFAANSNKYSALLLTKPSTVHHHLCRAELRFEILHNVNVFRRVKKPGGLKSKWVIIYFYRTG